MITKEIALTLKHGDILYHKHNRNADGTPVRARVTGKCKTWKTKFAPTAFSLPMKHGLRTSFYLGDINGKDWTLYETEALMLRDPQKPYSPWSRVPDSHSKVY